MQLQSMPSAACDDDGADAPASEARPVTPERPGSEDAPACDAGADDDDAREQSLAKALDSHGAHRHETWMELMTDLLFVSLAYNCGYIIKDCGVSKAIHATWIPFFSCYQAWLDVTLYANRFASPAASRGRDDGREISRGEDDEQR